MTVLELEDAAMVGGGELAAAEADLVEAGHFNQPVCVSIGQVVPQHD